MTELTTATAIATPEDADIMPVRKGSVAGLLKITLAQIASFVVGKSPFDLAFYIPVAPTALQVIFFHKFARKVTLPVGLTGSKFESLIAATASTTVKIQKNGTDIGTLVWAAAGTVPTVTFTTATTFDPANNDKLTLVAPGTPDATLAGIAAAMLFTRTA